MFSSLVLFTLVTAAAASTSYNNFQVWRLEVSQEQKVPVNHILQKHDLDVWGQGKDWIDVMVDPKLRHGVMSFLATQGIRGRLMIDNVQTHVERDLRSLASRANSSFAFDQYNTFEDIEAYLAGLAETDDRTSLRSLGQSVEGRDLWQLTISVGAGKQGIWFDCGIHAREWITQATCLWGINFLLNNYGSDDKVTQLLDSYDVHVLPVYNPDGYAYTASNRLWRKNRQQTKLGYCIGIDLNRNFDDHFGEMGSSNYPCSQTYAGPSAASELETQAVQAALKALLPKAVFSLHSYSQLWMYPFGYTDQLPAEADELHRVAGIGVRALKAVHGVEYDYGSICSILYPASGNTIDYSYALGITYSYTLELRDKGKYGFLLPANQIVPTAEETWAGIIAAVLAIP